MNPHTGQTTPVDLAALRDDPAAERARAAREVGLDDPDDLVLVEGREENVEQIAAAAREKARRRAANKRARRQRKANR